MASLSLWVDESVKGGFLVVGGVMAKWDLVPSIVTGWREVKASFGLPPEAEIKWTLGEKHPTRKALGSRINDLRKKVTDFVAGRNELSCIAAVMVERRKTPRENGRSQEDNERVRDFYCEGLKYLIQRAAEEVVEKEKQKEKRDCVVVCDRPGLGKKWFRDKTLRRGQGAVEKTYEEWYRNGVSPGPGEQYYDGPLADIGFHPSVLIGDATYHDMLQIADVVAGVTREWVDAVRNNLTRSRKVDYFKAVSVRFRKRHGHATFFGGGFVLHPPDDNLWTSLKQSLR
jgi:hypothetical protein